MHVTNEVTAETIIVATYIANILIHTQYGYKRKHAHADPELGTSRKFHQILPSSLRKCNRNIPFRSCNPQQSLHLQLRNRNIRRS